MEQETTQQCALPFPSKYGRIDKRYRFSDRASLTSLFMDYPLYDNRYPRQFPYGRRLNVPTEQSALAAHEVNRYYGYKALPEVVLLCIFKYMHPVDLVNGVSRVSKHWNALAKTPALYQEVRVLINRESAECGSAKEFLQRSRNHIEKLCLVYESNVFVDVLPDCMPNVKALDIGFFREMAKNVDKLTSCFPSVEMLYMDNVGKINSDVADKLFSETSFKRLRRLCLNVDGGIVDDMMQKLYAWNRPLELLNTCGVAKYVLAVHPLTTFYELRLPKYFCVCLEPKIFFFL
ncbi:unnamed protein product [Toxocara canis]|uniref:F-box domain-containing protein n=1 Tax=Toxocara canis TaxID=6265 RepID=A0A183UVV4_TOXCA|nr:unnamed protein product [Toxocara canis]